MAATPAAVAASGAAVSGAVSAGWMFAQAEVIDNTTELWQVLGGTGVAALLMAAAYRWANHATKELRRSLDDSREEVRWLKRLVERKDQRIMQLSNELIETGHKIPVERLEVHTTEVHIDRPPSARGD